MDLSNHMLNIHFENQNNGYVFCADAFTCIETDIIQYNSKNSCCQSDVTQRVWIGSNHINDWMCVLMSTLLFCNLWSLRYTWLYNTC